MNEIVPFGKYKDKPVEILAADKEYLEWLLSTNWFKSKYEPIYNIFINNFQQHVDTPEHNKLQIKFLDKDYRLRFAYALAGDRIFEYTKVKMDQYFNEAMEQMVKFFEKEYENTIVNLNNSISFEH